MFFNTSFLQLGSGFGNTLKNSPNNTIIQTPIKTRFGILNSEPQHLKKRKEKEKERGKERERKSIMAVAWITGKKSPKIRKCIRILPLQVLHCDPRKSETSLGSCLQYPKLRDEMHS